MAGASGVYITEMASFNVVIVQPQDKFFVSAAFREIAALLQFALQSLGHRCEVQINIFEPAAVNIVLGYHLLESDEPIRGHDCIVYQLEQLPDQHQGWLSLDERKIAVMKAARALWDFSPENIAFLARNGVEGAWLVPFGFHEKMETIADSEPEIDVFFYGAITKRRKLVLEQLAQRCRVKTSFGVYGQRRDQFIARSKIVLNLRSSAGPSIMEQPRISYLLNNRRFVVTEDSADNPYGDAVVATRYDDLADCCMRYLADDAERRRMAQRGYAVLAERPMSAYLAAVLG